nr:hypothetical protein [Bacteroidota bacterium]
MWFAYNAGAKSNQAEGNIITVSNNVNGVGISMMEGFKNISGSYNIAGNTLNLQNAIGGIVGSLVFKPIINYNIINQTNTLAIPTNSTAIVIDGCDNAMVNCNSIFSNYPSNAMHVSRGMEVSTSVNFNVSCNNIVNENCAIYFGNNCGATNTFKANTFDGCDMGLYLNTTAIIGQQLQKGNKWLNVLGQYNAENQGSPIFSPIIVHGNLNTIWHPLNYSSGNWFLIVAGTPGNCNSDCIAQFTNSDDTLLLRRIANDSALTNAFVQENKSMGGQFLFDLLDTNIQLRMSDSLLYSFWLQHKYNTYGILNEEGDKVNEAFNGNSYLMGMMDTTMQLIQFKLDSLILLDNLQAVNVNTNYSQLMAEVKERYIQLQATLYSIRSSMSNSQNERFSEADSINQMVQPTEVPEYNQTIMQDIMLQASIVGMDSVASRYQDAWAIAQQCPYRWCSRLSST